MKQAQYSSAVKGEDQSGMRLTIVTGGDVLLIFSRPSSWESMMTKDETRTVQQYNGV